MTTNAFGLEGQVLVGRYRLLRPLSSGSMGTVWRADDLTLGSPVAIKMLGPLYAKDETVRARFYQEAQAAAALRSPNVVQILDHGVENDVPFIAMELLEGEDLAHRLERVGALEPADTARIFADVARAVRKAHDAGIVHRDLKPDNIFLARDDDREVAKVLDFGVAKTRMSGKEGIGTQAGVLIGTLPYMSPEQAQGATVDYRSDLWALGVIAFECVCGRAAITAEAPGAMILEICSDPLPVPSKVASVPVPPAFDEWFMQACSRDPNGRFASATAMVDALRDALLPSSDAQEGGRASVSSIPGGAGTTSPSVPPISAAPLSAAPLSGPPISTSPLSVSPDGSVASPPGLYDEAGADSRPRRKTPGPAVALGLAASVLGGVLFIGWRALGDDPIPHAPPSGAASPRGTLETPPVAAPANNPPAEANSPRGAPELAPPQDTAASTPAPRAGSALAASAPAAAASSVQTAPARPGRAASSPPRPRPSSAPPPAASSATRTRSDRLGF
ncbi:protein kinase domain-containing protein [Sorangium sp. So ce145]|uniref:serine/threonine-protein kinase n=1 Tax=Sorangium sp. So ce145 TaxID=3133285 RepID=UPI003F61ADFF